MIRGESIECSLNANGARGGALEPRTLAPESVRTSDYSRGEAHLAQLHATAASISVVSAVLLRVLTPVLEHLFGFGSNATQAQSCKSMSFPSFFSTQKPASRLLTQVGSVGFVGSQFPRQIGLLMTAR